LQLELSKSQGPTLEKGQGFDDHDEVEDDINRLSLAGSHSRRSDSQSQ